MQRNWKKIIEELGVVADNGITVQEALAKVVENHKLSPEEQKELKERHKQS